MSGEKSLEMKNKFQMWLLKVEIKVHITLTNMSKKRDIIRILFKSCHTMEN